MADIAWTAAKVSPIYPRFAEIYPMTAAVALTAGQFVYENSAGKAALADANASGLEQVAGIVLESVGAGQATSVLKRGHVAGATISQAYNAPLYLSDTAGAIADAASGTKTVPVGRVTALTDDGTLTKCIYIECNWGTTY